MSTVIAEAADDYAYSSIRTWGDFTSVYRIFEVDSGEHSSSNWLNTITINASSYIWQPWFALINGSLSLSEDETKRDGESDANDSFSTGKIRFNLFPSSRFPFMMYLNKSRSEFDSFDFTRKLDTREYGFLQNYRTLDGKHNFRVSYRDNEKSSNSELDTINSRNIIFSGSSHLDVHSIYTDLQADDVKSSGQEAINYSVTGRHTYSNQKNFSLSNVLSTSKSERDFDQSFSDTTTAQYSGLLSWRPDGRSDISITGSLRVSDLEINQDLAEGSDTNSQIEKATVNINQGLIYQYSKALLLSESINVSINNRDTEREQIIGNETLGLSYSPARSRLTAGDYGWNATSSISNQHGDLDAIQSLSFNFSHSLMNESADDSNRQFRNSISQGISHDLNSEGRESTRLEHGFTASWNSSHLDKQTILRLQATDSRSLDDNSEIQLLNLQYSGHLRVSRLSRLSGNLTFQRTHQANGASKSVNSVANGQLDYNRDRVFNIPGMNFKSQLKLNRQLSEDEKLLEQIRQETSTEMEWKNTFLYQVGRLDMELHLDTLKQSGRYDYLVRFQITRSFGDL